MTTEAGRPSPSEVETEVVLKDGSLAIFRPIRADDTGRWLAFVNGLTPHSLYLRFHHARGMMEPEDAVRFCTVDYKNTFAFVAELPRGETRDIIAIGRYVRLPDERSAEVAFVVDEAHQGKGIGTRLLEWLIRVARRNGIKVFEADVLAENGAMMKVFSDYGFHVTSVMVGGVYHVVFPIVRTRAVVRKEEKREMDSTLAALRAVLHPRSVAVIGASREAGTIGHLVMQSIMQGEFSGVVYPVNPKAEAILSVKAYPSVLDIPGQVDMALIAVPAPAVVGVADECGRKGVQALIVISDGFRERGAEGALREQELRLVTLGHGMRLVGPNCMGVINTDPAVRLNATFSLVRPQPGNIAFLSQSGAMGLVVLEYARNFNLGLSSFASIGNRADISPIDLLQYWEQDPATRVILLYLESFGDPRKLGRIARRVSASKPIVVVKGGSTAAGSRAAESHTGSLATPDIMSDALFRQAGVVRVNTVEQLFDVAGLLSTQPMPRGRRLAIVTNGGGPGIIAADAATHHRLVLPELSAETRAAVKAVARRDISFGNPLDLTAGATAAEFLGVLKVLAQDPDIDAVLAIFVPPVVIGYEEMDNALRRMMPVFRRRGKVLLTCFIGQRGMLRKLGTGHKPVPSFLFPEGAVAALEKAVQCGEIARRQPGSIPRIRGLRRARAGKIVQEAMAGNPQRPLWLPADAVSELLSCYGIQTIETLAARTPGEAAAIAAKMGFPVAVKLNSATITHKTDVGGVMLNIASAEEVEAAFDIIRGKLQEIGRESEMRGVTVQRMVKGGVEAIAGVTQDPSFGPVIMFGIGGIYAELLNDVAVALHPLTDRDARDLIGSVRMARLFEGFRGSPPADTPALRDMLLRLSALVEDVPQISELDLNPVRVMPQGEGYRVVDSRVLLR